MYKWNRHQCQIWYSWHNLSRPQPIIYFCNSHKAHSDLIISNAKWASPPECDYTGSFLTAVPSTMSLQMGLSPLPSLKSSRLSTTTWPIRSCLENRSKSYTEKCSFLECSSFSGTLNWNVSLNTGFKVFLWTWERQTEFTVTPID